MKYEKYNMFIRCFVGIPVIACVDEDASTDVNVPSQIVLSDDTPVNAKVKEMYEKYGSYFIYKFDDLDLRYDCQR